MESIDTPEATASEAVAPLAEWSENNPFVTPDQPRQVFTHLATVELEADDAAQAC